ncbi:MAG: hypothetical protein FD138_2304 [Planctomycetota bacterium]|nr:MAG: hypothetical protein FD138_2304 [Planctomycetota bacterium]
MADALDLWLRVESDEFAISFPRRFRGLVRLFPADRLIALDQLLLRSGVFVGAARACPLRLESLQTLVPQFVLRVDSKLRWRLMGFGGKVQHNRYELADHAIVLEIGDTITCGPYCLRVVVPPDPQQLLQELVEKTLPDNPGESEFTDSETDFLLNVR